jgi:acetate kinase
MPNERMSDAQMILTLNAGSSSLKFALFRSEKEPERVISGSVGGIGSPDQNLSLRNASGEETERTPISAPDHTGYLAQLMERIRSATHGADIRAIGHRVVHGGPHFYEPQLITSELLDELHRISPFDPEHLPAEIALIELLRRRCPHAVQIACFDTAFHRQMPRVAQIIPIPRKFAARGVRRYGFHGLSYSYLMEELARVAGPQAAQGRVILAHLGSGASLAAVRDGKSIETTMSFTPASGVPMSTPAGDLDPGLVWFLAQTEQMTAQEFHQMVNSQSGLLGVSETSSDLRELLAREMDDLRAAEAVALFCYEIKKRIGAFAAALGGLDTLVFAGGIGENSGVIRHRICDGLDFLGLVLDQRKNETGVDVISSGTDRVTVRVIPTDEERMIARAVARLLSHPQGI